MDKNRLVSLKGSFDGISHQIPEQNVEYWLARDLMSYLGYTRWENFVDAIHRAETACSTQNNDVSNHFRDVTKMIDLPKGAKREIADVMLSTCWASVASFLRIFHRPPISGSLSATSNPKTSTLEPTPPLVSRHQKLPDMMEVTDRDLQLPPPARTSGRGRPPGAPQSRLSASLAVHRLRSRGTRDPTNRPPRSCSCARKRAPSQAEGIGGLVRWCSGRKNARETRFVEGTRVPPSTGINRACPGTESMFHVRIFRIREANSGTPRASPPIPEGAAF